MGMIKKESFWRKIFIEIAISLFCVLLSWGACAVVGRFIEQYTDDANKMSYIIRYYNWINRSGHDGNSVEDIILINFHEDDPQDSLMRKNIARALERIAGFEPRTIALDIRFNGKHNAQEDSLLERVVLDNKDRIVIARSIFYDKENRSFFDTDSSFLMYGYTNVLRGKRQKLHFFRS